MLEFQDPMKVGAAVNVADLLTKAHTAQRQCEESINQLRYYGDALKRAKKAMCFTGGKLMKLGIDSIGY